MITEIISLCIVSYLVNGCGSTKIKSLAMKKSAN